MPRQSLDFDAPPAMPVAVGATSPDPKKRGVPIWSTLTNQQLLWNGSSWQPSGALYADLEGPGYTEVLRASEQVSSTILWTSAAKVQKVQETTITRSNGAVSLTVVKQYDAAGALAHTVTSTISRTATGRVAGITVVRS